MSVETVLSKLQTYSEELGLDLTQAEDRFKWFLASILFAKRISADIAKKTFQQFEEEAITTPEKILKAGWDRLVEILDDGGYVRYDFSTASTLLKIMEELKEIYGDLETLHRESIDPNDLERRLQDFKGVGPVCVNIFLRELRGIWEKAKPEPSKMAIKIARQIKVKDIESYESALVRLNLEYCKKHKCNICIVQKYCKGKNNNVIKNIF